jgi:LysM domain
MSAMSTGRASLSAAVGAEFRPVGDRTEWAEWTAGPASAPCDAAGPNNRAERHLRIADPRQRRERRERGLRVTELYFRELRVRQVRATGVRRRPVRASAAQRPQPPGPVSGRAPQLRAHEMGARRSRPGDLTDPVRLTRRGRAVVASLAMLAAAAIVALLWLSLAAGAQAASAGQSRQPGQSARSGYLGMTRIVVRPGQTLWSIAAAAEPSADPRIVIPQIMEANALSGTSIRAGELLWVPKG